MEASSKRKAQKVHTSALCWIPASEQQPTIQALRRQYDKQINRWPPHVNMLYPFVPLAEFESAAARLSEVLRDHAPFSVVLSRVTSFRHSKKSLTAWLEPAPLAASVWQELQAACQAAFPHCTDQTSRGAFVPHLTIGQFTADDPIEQLASEWSCVDGCLVGDLCLIHRAGPTEPFEVQWRVPLGGGAPVAVAAAEVPSTSLSPTSPASAATFDKLPAELVNAIFAHAEDWKALGALAAASKRATDSALLSPAPWRKAAAVHFGTDQEGQKLMADRLRVQRVCVEGLLGLDPERVHVEGLSGPSHIGIRFWPLMRRWPGVSSRDAELCLAATEKYCHGIASCTALVQRLTLVRSVADDEHWAAMAWPGGAQYPDDDPDSSPADLEGAEDTEGEEITRAHSRVPISRDQLLALLTEALLESIELCRQSAVAYASDASFLWRHEVGVVCAALRSLPVQPEGLGVHCSNTGGGARGRAKRGTAWSPQGRTAWREAVLSGGLAAALPSMLAQLKEMREIAAQHFPISTIGYENRHRASWMATFAPDEVDARMWRELVLDHASSAHWFAKYVTATQ